jgi:uncharacterized protein YndB with AHSA1/START domain
MISVTRTFDAPPDRVFTAWTDPAQFAHWFGGAGTTVQDVAMDVRPGGVWRARMVLDNGATEIPWRGTYQEVDRPSRLVFTLTDRHGDEYELVTVVLKDVEGGTEMTFTQEGGHMPPGQYARAEEGWRAFFDDMASLLGG